MSDFKTNHDLLERQQREFAKSGAVLRSVLSVSVQHPALSLIFILSFGLLTNALFELASYVATNTAPDWRTTTQLLLLVGLFAVIPILMYTYVRRTHAHAFVPTLLDQKKVLITIVSNNRSDFKQTPAYTTYRSLLYNPAGHAAPNALQKVILVTSEAPEVQATAAALKNHIEAGSRTADIYNIAVGGKSLLEIQKQLEVLFSKLRADYRPHEVIADYTGGTKDMSIALLRASEKELVVPVYLNSAATDNHSRYN